MNDKDNTPLPTTDLEPDIGNASVGAEKASRLDTRVNITVISYRNRKHDPDGISVKAVLDGIIRAGILSDDSTEEINKITFKSIISKDEEKTEIVIEPQSPHNPEPGQS